MPSKKELQEQIDELRKELNDFKKATTILKSTTLLFSDKLIKPINIQDFYIDYVVDIVELRKQFLALLDYLKLEYKVEDKHLEGFKKK